MDPKFQSSFIPKSSVIPSSGISAAGTKVIGTSFLSFLSSIIFMISVVLALGVFGYKFYLKYEINRERINLAEAQKSLESDAVNNLIRLDSRILATENLIHQHRVFTPLFAFLESSTPKSARFNDFQYEAKGSDLMLTMKGEAKSYASLALLANILNKSGHFKNSVFSDISLDQKGDVNFTFKSTIDSKLVSYDRILEKVSLPPTSISTSSPASNATSSQP